MVPGLALVHNVAELSCVINVYHLSMSPDVMGVVVPQNLSFPPPLEAGGVTGGHRAAQGEVAHAVENRGVLSLNLCSYYGI